MENNLGNKQTMAENIRHYMAIRGIDRIELSNNIDTPYTTVCDWLNAKTYPRIDRIEKMAKYFGITKSDLVEQQDASEEASRYLFDDDAQKERWEKFNKFTPALQKLGLEMMNDALKYLKSDK